MQLKSLRAWLKRPCSPPLHQIQVRLLDGEDKFIQIPADERSRWKIVEQSILATGAVSVTLLDKQGNVIRAQELDSGGDGEEGDDADPEVAAEKRQARAYEGMSKMLDAQASALNVAFSKGKEAASQSQDSLVSIVDSLASHLSAAITNMHTVVANMATVQQMASEREAKLIKALAEGSESGDGTGAIAQLLAPVIAGMAAGGAAPNGKKVSKS